MSFSARRRALVRERSSFATSAALLAMSCLVLDAGHPKSRVVASNATVFWTTLTHCCRGFARLVMYKGLRIGVAMGVVMRMLRQHTSDSAANKGAIGKFSCATHVRLA